MPFVSVEALDGKTVEQKRALAKAITDAVVDIYGVQRDQVRVVIRGLAKEDIAWGGVLFCDKKK